MTDLGSANGTYANGHAVALETRLQDGDRLFLGAVALRIERVEKISEDAIRLRPEGRPLGARDAETSRTMHGSIAEISLPVLLRLLGVTKKTCALSLVRGARPGEAMLVLRRGEIVSVEIDRVKARTRDEARQAIAGLMAWDGDFDVTPPPNIEDDSMLLTVDDIVGPGRLEQSMTGVS